MTCPPLARTGCVHADLFLSGCPAPRHLGYLGIGFLVIDGAIGEYDAVAKMGRFTILNPREPGMGVERIPFAEFSRAFDELFERECCKGV